MKFQFHDIGSAPAAVKQDLESTEAKMGSVPNLYRGLAASPAALKIYLAMSETFAEYSVLTPVEQQVVYLTVSAENDCHYCMGAHTTLAGMVNMPEKVLQALRDQRQLPDEKLNALREFTLAVLRHEGHVPAPNLVAFQAAGFDQTHLGDVIAHIAQKTSSNFYNHMAETPLDAMFEASVWQPTA